MFALRGGADGNEAGEDDVIPITSSSPSQRGLGERGLRGRVVIASLERGLRGRVVITSSEEMFFIQKEERKAKARGNNVNIFLIYFCTSFLFLSGSEQREPER